MNKKFALEIIRKTREDYNKIADHFNVTRAYPWKNLVPHLNRPLKNGDKILDLGCGNGRLLLALDKKINYTGIDGSEKLIKIASELHPKEKFVIEDILNLPFDKESFDLIYSVAVIHHIPSEELRLNVLSEIKRCLRSKGKAVITAWNLEKMEKYQEFACYEKEGWEKGDYLIPWKNSKGEIITQRYYHTFTFEEIADLFKKVGFKILEKKEIEFNFFFVLEK
ncbi:MAG: class I SAM-dependent methyltransferase [Patescibacteria group bacterium]|nr:class I SAM-dependent methyltransferase [Patescibacteria group bacterium]